MDVGENATLKVVLPPAAIVFGTARPLMLKPVPDTFAWEIVTLVVPLFFRLIVCELVLPMTTLPKLALAGVEISEPLCDPEGKISMALMIGTFAFARCANRMTIWPPVTEI